MPRQRHRSSTPKPLPPHLLVGVSVRVKAGVKDPDYGHSLGGRQGRVTEIMPEGVVEFAWDSVTLLALPAAEIDRAEDDGLDWSRMQLNFADVEVTSARDTPMEVDRVKEQVQEHHAWAFLGPEGQQIQKVLQGVDPKDEWALLHTWQKHFQAKLKFPLTAQVAELGGGLRADTRVQIIGLEAEPDDKYGVLVRLGGPHAGRSYPLCDLEVTPNTTPPYDWVRAYVVWFANR